MHSGARSVFAIFAWLFFAAVVYQVFLAGMGLLGDGDMESHVGFGWTIPLFTFPLLIMVWPAHLDRRTVGLTILLVVLTFIQTSLPQLRTDAPAVAALHPVNALAIFWVSLTIARRSTVIAREALAAEDLAAAHEA